MIEINIIEKKENELDSIVEITGLSTQVSVQSILDHKKYCEDLIKKADVQIDIFDKQDILAFDVFPMIKEIPEDKLHLVVAYANRLNERKELEQMKSVSQETIKLYEERLEQIKNLGINIDGNETPTQN